MGPRGAGQVLGALVAALDLHRHEAVVEHSDGRARSVPLTPDRPAGSVTRECSLGAGAARERRRRAAAGALTGAERAGGR